MKLIEAKAVVEYTAPQQGALMMFIPAIRVILKKLANYSAQLIFNFRNHPPKTNTPTNYTDKYGSITVSKHFFCNLESAKINKNSKRKKDDVLHEELLRLISMKM
jgi:hypothetical protein